MNKLDLVVALHQENGLTRTEAATAVRLFFDQITKALTTGHRVQIRGFCSFQLKKYRGYTGRNPRSGYKVKVGPKRLPSFKYGEELIKTCGWCCSDWAGSQANPP